ncbi:MAG TPA: nuclear transport factor 2 family protein [Usitatibacter sp.]
MPNTAVDVVQRQVDAYNARDLARFVAEFSDAVQVFRPPSTQPAISGKAQLAEYYAANRFNLPALRADILNRIVLGSRVIDHERIHGVRDEPFEVAAVYDVVDGLIRTVWFFAAD